MGRKPFNLGADIRILPPNWPKVHAIAVRPGDLSQFAPYGNRVCGSHDNKKNVDPLRSAPSQEVGAGTIFFDNDITRIDLQTLLRVLGINGSRKGYAVFQAEAEHPEREGYLVQLRIVSSFALCSMFNAIREMEDLPDQALTTEELIWRFFEHERDRWGTSFEDDDQGLRGLFGGDGNFAREQLAFGFLVENSYFGVYRVWSRAWLVTK